MTANDGAGDADTGPNQRQNFPSLTSAKSSAGQTTIQGSLASKASKSFVIEFFVNPSGGRVGKQFLGQKTVTTAANGKVQFSFHLTRALTLGQRITATARDPAGNTSEFSAPRVVTAP